MDVEKQKRYFSLALMALINSSCSLVLVFRTASTQEKKLSTQGTRNE